MMLVMNSNSWELWMQKVEELIIWELTFLQTKFIRHLNTSELRKQLKTLVLIWASAIKYKWNRQIRPLNWQAKDLTARFHTHWEIHSPNRLVASLRKISLRLWRDSKHCAWPAKQTRSHAVHRWLPNLKAHTTFLRKKEAIWLTNLRCKTSWMKITTCSTIVHTLELPTKNFTLAISTGLRPTTWTRITSKDATRSQPTSTPCLTRASSRCRGTICIDKSLTATLLKIRSL